MRGGEGDVLNAAERVLHVFFLSFLIPRQPSNAPFPYGSRALNEDIPTSPRKSLSKISATDPRRLESWTICPGRVNIFSTLSLAHEFP